MRIDEITRRDLLKGLGAAGALAATGVSAAPFKHGTFKDPLDGSDAGGYSKVRSNDSKANLMIQWKGK